MAAVERLQWLERLREKYASAEDAAKGEKVTRNTINHQCKDYRNRSIIVHDAVWIVVNSIAGMPQDKLDKMIESWRKNAAKN